MEEKKQKLLIVEAGPEPGKTYVVQFPCTVGRSRDNNIAIDDPRISRHHTRIYRSMGRDQIEDIGSTNGTWLNNVRITRPTLLTPGDLIQLADTVTLRFVIEGEPVTAAPSPADFPEPELLLEEEIALPEVLPDEGMSVALAVAQADPLSSPALPRGISTLLIGLVILILISLGFAAYLWFAPEASLKWLLDMLGVRLPQAVICMRLAL
ncbi:MAG: FHA domain-containing protein [Anaerolineae bacterium]|nr:FHA domain-containing protein [Anaerolineae bacterium]